MSFRSLGQVRQESCARMVSRHCSISAYAYSKGMERGSVVGLGFGGSSLPPVLSVEEVAALMRINRKTAYAAIAEGEVPGVRRLGRCIRVSRDVLLRWLAEGEGGKVERRRGRR
jgi:excisionase family DNA binding protein